MAENQTHLQQHTRRGVLALLLILTVLLVLAVRVAPMVVGW